ncbi:DNA binding protein VP5 [Gokushovirinae Bog1183_53]|uniref:DNA binding protein VP5 n=1 Tax=Gokushovirinae Bog1183_53 TaxID=1655646 RepID=UPI00063D6059|nr:DNA binding protein VP5 [Gokushovirinae Bog1183_53]AKI26869.1 DNA binding protein VP5 [Gokushovirinae Bog1183_53]
MRTNAEAIRWFIDLVNSGKSELGIPSHPEDYTLFEIGSFEESNGDIDVLAAKVSLGLALNFVKPVGNGG